MLRYDCEQKRLHYADGTWADLSLVRCQPDALTFTDIVHDDPQVRMRDAARLRYFKARIRGEQNPLVIAWACLETDRHVQHMFPTLNTTSHTGEHFISTNAFVTYVLRELIGRGWLRWQRGEWYADIPVQNPAWEETAVVVLQWLMAEERLWLEAGPEHPQPASARFEACDPLLHLSAVGCCGFIRDTARQEMPAAAFNTSFFLLEHDDYVSHYSALGNPYGLLVVDGAITRPPLYTRSTIWQDAAGSWHTGSFGMADVQLHLSDGLTLYPPGSTVGGPHFAINPENEAPIAVYTRHFGVSNGGVAHGATPASTGRFELVIIDREVVGWKRGGYLMIPQNGYALSFAAARDDQPLTELGDLSLNIEALRGLLEKGQITYSFDRPSYQGMRHAQQTGPLLLQDGQLAISDSRFIEEEFWISQVHEGQYRVGIVPTEFPVDAARTRAARIGIGITRDGSIIVAAISGSSKGVARPGVDSIGATLVELAEALAAAGAVHAINLDGGGSTQVFVEGGLYNSPGDRRGRQGVSYERMVPTIGVIRAG